MIASAVGVFSFGAVLYEMATSRQPFRGGTAAAILAAISSEAPAAPVRLNAELPEGLEGIVSTALEKDPELRYQSAAEMRADLRRLKRDLETGRTAAAREETRRKAYASRAWMMATALLAVLLAALVFIHFRQGTPKTAAIRFSIFQPQGVSFGDVR